MMYQVDGESVPQKPVKETENRFLYWMLNLKLVSGYILIFPSTLFQFCQPIFLCFPNLSKQFCGLIVDDHTTEILGFVLLNVWSYRSIKRKLQPNQEVVSPSYSVGYTETARLQDDKVTKEEHPGTGTGVGGVTEK